MDFTVEQTYAAAAEAVALAYTEPELYALVGEASPLGRPEVVGRTEDGDVVRLQVRYRFAGELSSAAKAVLDPAKLTWVEHSEHDLAQGTVAYRLAPDNYADRFTASGSCTLAAGPDGTGCVRTVRGRVGVRALVVGGAVERAIVSGLGDHLRHEATAVDRYLAG